MNQEHNTGARMRFGTRDWRHAGWTDSYYPEDMPEDWRLGYYANELNALLLPADAWQGLGQDDLGALADEAHEDFRFYLEADANAARPDLVVFGDRLGGVVGDAGLAPLDGDLPEGVTAWGDGQVIRLAVLRLDGMDLRARRAVLEALAPRFAEGDVAVILEGKAVSVAEVRELQTVAELLGIA